MSDKASVGAARQRADEAKLREIAAHKRAISLHGQAAMIFDERGAPGLAAAARARAVRACEMLATALLEQARSPKARTDSVDH